MTIIIKANDTDHEQWLESKTKIIEYLMSELSKFYKFKPPKSVILRPTQFRKRRLGFLMGRAGRYRGMYFIALLPIVASDETIAHEVAHVAELLKYNSCGHGKNWMMMYEKALEILKEGL